MLAHNKVLDKSNLKSISDHLVNRKQKLNFGRDKNIAGKVEMLVTTMFSERSVFRVVETWQKVKGFINSLEKGQLFGINMGALMESSFTQCKRV